MPIQHPPKIALNHKLCVMTAGRWLGKCHGASEVPELFPAIKMSVDRDRRPNLAPFRNTASHPEAQHNCVNALTRH
jgi:hypothetical protein